MCNYIEVSGKLKPDVKYVCLPENIYYELLAALDETMKAFIGQYRMNHGHKNTYEQNTEAINRLPGIARARAAIARATGQEGG